MKKFLTTFLLAITTIIASAQTTNNNVLKFLGHPVDGHKSNMESHLISKGFTYNRAYDCYKGRFNGKQVNVYISTNNNNIIDRIYVAFPTTSEQNIRYEYNNLISQFNNNNKYTYLFDNEEITERENISYEISVNNKRYEASYYYIAGIDTLAIQQEFQEELTRRYTPKQLEELTEDDLIRLLFEKIADTLTGNVWFTIHESYGNYNIGLYYDNLNNRPNGEDL